MLAAFDIFQMSLVFSEEEWQIEWENLLQLSAVSKKYVDVNDDQRYVYPKSTRLELWLL
mgnify:FL=1